MGVVSFLMFFVSALLLIDRFFLSGAVYAALPWFAVPAIAFSGFIIALIWRGDLKDKPKKKSARRCSASLVFMALNLMVCITAALFMLLSLVPAVI